MLCSKGMNLNYVINNQNDRILYPYVRWSKSHPLTRTSWDTALEKISKTFATFIEKHGPDSVGLYVSGQCLTEEYYIANKLTKGFLGTNNIDTNSRLCMSSAVAGYIKTLGEDSVPISYDDIEISDCMLISGANPAWCHPILYRRIEKRKEYNNDVKIIVIDPRETDTCAIADLHLKITPGTDVALLMAIGKILISKNKIDKNFIKNHTDSYNDYKRQVSTIRLKEAAKYCGITYKELVTTATMIGNSKRFISMWAMGLNQSVNGVDKNLALLNLHLLTGTLGKNGCGPFSLTGQPNAMGGREVGGMASLLAAHKNLKSAEDRQEVARYWDSKSINPEPGLTATEMFQALESGKMKAIWIICTNPAVSMPNSNLVRSALKKAKLVVVQDISHKSLTTKYADVLLPAAGWAEKEGTMTNSERRISYLPKIIDPPGEALPDVEILCRFAEKMNFHGFQYEKTSDIYDEYCQMTKGSNIDISGLSYKRLKEEGTFQWPVPHLTHPGTKRLFEDFKFYTDTERAKFNIIKQIENKKSDKLTLEHPLILTTGRIRDQWHTMTKTGKVSKLNQHIPESYVEIHPEDGLERNIKNNGLVEIINQRGVVRIKSKISDKIKKGTIFIPMHFSSFQEIDLLSINNLIGDHIDPTSKQPEFKYAAVNIRNYSKKKETICVIGAGAAAYRFTQSYRDLNTKDEIVIFSKEPNAFYNRVLLPEYTSEQLTWSKLEKISSGQLRKQDINIHYSCAIENIDRANKIITDQNGQKYPYDKLILATGSRPFIPKDVPIHLNGVFTLRNRRDADLLKKYIEQLNKPQEAVRVLVVGGGLLGLEIAAALKERNHQISIVQRGSRLMERQLDLVGSELLAVDVMERGIQTYFNNEVYTIFEASQNMNVTLKSGKKIVCDIVVYAIGTTPNIEVAKEAGIDCGRGVTINEHLRTSDPDIFAVGEIAEFKKRLYGITAAAEQQADVLSQYIAGDINAHYTGSTLLNILKFEDLDLCSIGIIPTGSDKLQYEEIIYTDVVERQYQKCVVKDDRLVGVVLIGDKSKFAEFRNLIENKIELSDKRKELLLGESNRTPLLGKVVCSCNNIGLGNLEMAINNGCTDFKTLCQSTGAGMGCGSCKPEVRGILKRTTLQEA
ncbi:UNVERIFIED_CONTAM: hypothetical protein GTU68_039330 [Idotea baltica]|nr:hypothetical protein [Idotea baltica]